MSLNTHFSHIYCLNLNRRPDRWESAQEQFKQYGIADIERFPAIDGKDVISEYSTRLNAGEVGIILSNIKIIEDAKQNKYASILILEDDISFSSELNNIDSYFAALPENWDAIYIGGNPNTHNTAFGVENRPPHHVNDRIGKMHNTYATHAVGLRESMYDIVIEEIRSLDAQLDVCFQRLQNRYNWYCFKSATGEAIATQMPNYSDITNSFQDNRWLIK